MKEGMTRRSFFGLLSIAISSFALLSPSSIFAFMAKEKWIVMGKADDFPVGKVVVNEKEKIFVFRNEAGFFAMSGKCTHFGCLVARGDKGIYDCPCHKSKYDELGRVVKGPAKNDLEWYQVKVENGKVFVNVKGVIEAPKAVPIVT